ncbi:MAG: hypothetical protein QM765_04925 [Myxococcales bacterium]
MGTLEWTVLAAGLAVGLGWWLRSLGKPSSAPSPGSSAKSVRPQDDQTPAASDEDEEIAEALAQKGAAAVGELIQRALADFREEDLGFEELPALVQKLGRSGVEALAENLARLAAEIRPSFMQAMEDAVGEVGKAAVGPLLRLATAENAQGIGALIGTVFRGVDNPREREERGLGQILAALKAEGAADPERRQVLLEVLDAAVEAQDAEHQRQLLSHAVPEVRAAAIRSATQVSEKVFKALARQTESCVRVALLSQSSLWYDRKSLIEPFFQDPSAEVRIEACLRAGFHFDGEVERLREDSSRAVALVARSVLEDEGMLSRIDGALASGKRELRLAACRAAGAQLEEKDALKVFAALQLDGSPTELRAFVEAFCPEELASLEQLVRFARSDPPAHVAQALDLALSYNDDIEGAADLPLQLLERGLPPRVRRLGFQVLLSVKEGRARRLEPYLVPDEPQLADFLWALRREPRGSEPDEKALYHRLAGSSHEQLKAFGEEQDD